MGRGKYAESTGAYMSEKGGLREELCTLQDAKGMVYNSHLTARL
jgi:hypothetical protein